MKAQQVADKRAQGGSRFNLRWSGSIPAEQLTPEAVMKLLADYVEFSGALVDVPCAKQRCASCHFQQYACRILHRAT